MVAYLTEKARLDPESPVRQGILLPGSDSSSDSLMLSGQPLCAMACINICVHVKDSYHCSHTQKYCTRQALVTAVPYPGRVTQISHVLIWDKEVLKKGNKNSLERSNKRMEKEEEADLSPPQPRK